MKGSLAEIGVALSDRLRELRHAAGLSQEQLAYRAGVTIGVVHKLEQGRVNDPQWSTIRALARVLGADLNDLSAAQDEPAKPVSRQAGRPKKGGK
jgi:transcriptional regulator with XRE-family HTH domain